MERFLKTFHHKGALMRHNLIATACIALLSSGSFAQTTLTFPVAGVTRTSIVHAPSGLSDKPPLMLQIHGYNIDGSLWQRITQMDKVADREKFIVVYPSALNKSWNMNGGDDLTFLRALIDTVDARYHIDRNRVYVSGFSQGGFMSFLMGCKYSDVVAAIAPVSGMLNGTCTLKRPVPMYLKFGTNDVATPSSFMASVSSWLKFDSCPSTPTVTRPYPADNPKSAVTRLSYGPCAQGSEVVVDSVRLGTHEWVLTTDTNTNTNEEVWGFLKRFSLKNTAISHQRTIVSMNNHISASYGSGIVRLQGVGEKCFAQVIDTKGRRITANAVVRRQFAFKNKPRGVYMVVVNAGNRPVAIKIAVP
jgi:poly(3-hydroxybutyrate) depolymerase